MIIAVKNNLPAKTIIALLEHGADPNMQDRIGKTALMFATLNNNVEVVKTLINYGAKLHILNNQGKQVVDLLSIKTDIEIVKTLRNELIKESTVQQTMYITI